MQQCIKLMLCSRLGFQIVKTGRGSMEGYVEGNVEG